MEKILNSWKKKSFKPVYWIEGDEDFYINKLINYAEHHILSEAEAGFNLTVFYGKDASWPDVVNACCRYPMFADKQVVLLKEAQHMKEIEKLTNYIVKPLASTVFIISYKEKKMDGRLSFGKLLKETSTVEFVSTKKLKDTQLTEWTTEMIAAKGFTISQKALVLVVENIGNDLTRIESEIEKLSVNLGQRKNITEDDIEKYVGISKEYNVFELQAAFAAKDLEKTMRILQFFETNPKANPIQVVLALLYSFFSKCFMAFSATGNDEASMAAAMAVSPWAVKNYMVAIRQYSFEGIERAVLLLHEYNLRSVGINDAGTKEGSLLKELAFKIIS